MPDLRSLSHAPQPRFGESVNAKLRDYRQWLYGTFQNRLTPADFIEPRDIFTKVQRALRQSEDDVTLKRPGDYVFAVWDKMGFAHRPDGPTLALEAKPKGFFWSDMQYLDHFEILPPKGQTLKLSQKSATDDRAAFDYTLAGNPAVTIHREDALNDRNLFQSLSFSNNSDTPVTFTVRMGASATDIFQARTGGTIKAPAAQTQMLSTANTADFTAFTANPDAEKKQLHPENIIQSIFNLREMANENIRLEQAGKNLVDIHVTVPAHGKTDLPVLVHSNNLYTELQAPRSAFNPDKWNSHQCGIQLDTSSKNQKLNQIFQTSLKDIQRLTIPMQVGGKTYFPLAAGIPNFMSLFGRDSIITAMQVLPFNPLPAKDTLYVLAHYQGDGYDAYREMEPGKIMHELRYGEMTRLGMTPHGPYYGTMDATPLFIMLMANYVERTGDVKLLDDLWPNLEAAKDWMDRNIVTDGPLEGFLAQRLREQTDAGSDGLKNISWKDSGHSMRHLVGKDGKLHDPVYPLAPAEVQGYVFGAYQALSDLYRLKGDPTQARAFDQKAQSLKQRFNNRYWMPDKDFIATALQGNGKQLPSVSSNGAQALLTGIVDDDKAAKMIPRLMKPDMLSGWGIRTLSSNEAAFDPLSYQNGSIWPHDNALIMAGVARYGYKKEAATIANQLFDAAKTFPDCRLPEVYAGFARKKGDRKIIPYPDTCTPQAWAAGSPLMLLSNMLALKINGHDQSIAFDKPVLPDGAKRLTLNGISLGGRERTSISI